MFSERYLSTLGKLLVSGARTAGTTPVWSQVLSMEAGALRGNGWGQGLNRILEQNCYRNFAGFFLLLQTMFPSAAMVHKANIHSFSFSLSAYGAEHCAIDRDVKRSTQDVSYVYLFLLGYGSNLLQEAHRPGRGGTPEGTQAFPTQGEQKREF